MTVIAEILDWLSGETGATIGPNPPEGGLAIVQSGGGVPDKHLDANMVATMQVILSSKGKNQLTALNAIDTAYKVVTKTLSFPAETAWQVINIDTITAPTLAEIEEEGAFFYNCILEITYYWREA